MKKIKTFLITVLTTISLYAQTNEDNIIIDYQTESYTYKSAAKQVILENKTTTYYHCLKWTETILVAEFYSFNSTIDLVDIKAEKFISPIYEMYKDKDVFYSDRKICYFELPFSKKGAKATVSFAKTYKDISFFNTIIFSEPQFVKEKKVEINVPSWLDVSIIEQNFNDGIEKEIVTDEKSRAVTYRYTLRNQAGIKRTEDAPEFHKIAPHILLIPKSAVLRNEKIVYFDSYDDVYKWCKDKIDQTRNEFDIVLNLTSQLITWCKTDEEKISTIFKWVQNNIRYLAFHYGLDGWIPDNAQNVLRKKYGDCKGMSNLLKIMLRCAGFDARLVWIGTNGLSKGTEIPLPQFDHMICALFKDEQILYLDPTAKYMMPGEYPTAIQGCFTLIEYGDNYLVDFVPEISPTQNTDSSICVYSIEENSLVGNVNMTLSGECKQEIMVLNYSLEASRRNSALKQFLEKGKSHEKVSDILIQGEDSKEKQILINYNENRNNSVIRIEDEIYVDLDSRKDYVTNIIDTAKRKVDFIFPYKKHTIREEYLLIPEGYKVIYLPAELQIENANCKISSTYSIENDRIKYRKEITIKDVWVKKEDFAQWNSDLYLLKSNYSEQIILQKE